MKFLLTLLGSISLLVGLQAQTDDAQFVSHIIDPKEQKIRFFWKDDEGKNILNFKQLRALLAEKGDSLVFAVNGGMYDPDFSPHGLYVEKGEILSEIDTLEAGYGNFYLQPNGIFYITSDFTPVICLTESFPVEEAIRYATQSGPLLLIDGEIHHRFIKGSTNVNIRNGVGILANGSLLFAMSRDPINFYDFATYFRKKGCRNALYLDGTVSRTYLPAQGWIQLDGSFGVIIGQVE